MGRGALIAGAGVAVLVGAAAIWWRRRRQGSHVKLVIIFSGKRKSGKDFCAEALIAALPRGVTHYGRLSAPLKRQYSQKKGLDYEKLLTASKYKEKYRADMIRWGEKRRQSDPGYFAREVVEHSKEPVLVISDARRLSDLEFFEKLGASVVPGWRFTPGVDDTASECALDGIINWDYLIINEPGHQTETASKIAELAEKATIAAGGKVVSQSGAPLFNNHKIVRQSSRL